MSEESQETGKEKISSKKDSTHSYDRGGMWAFLLSVLFSFVFFAWVIGEGRKIHLYKGPLEESKSPDKTQEMSQPTKTKQTDGSQADLKFSDQVWESSSGSIAQGKKLYSTNCHICHGTLGKGDGVAGKNLDPPPSNFVKGKWRVGGSSIQLFRSITKGVPNSSMASFKHLPVKDRWALVHFIRSITQNRVQDNPEKLKSFAESVKE